MTAVPEAGTMLVMSPLALIAALSALAQPLLRGHELPVRLSRAPIFTRGTSPSVRFPHSCVETRIVSTAGRAVAFYDVSHCAK